MACQRLVLALLPLVALVPSSGRCGLVAWWQFEDGSGTIATDPVGGHDATLQNGAAWSGQSAPTTYPNTDSVSFDGSNDFVQAVGYKGIVGKHPRTFSAWIKTTGKNNESIISWGQNQPGRKWNFRVQTSNGTPGAIRLEVNGGYIVGDTDVRDDAWHHVAAVLPEVPNPNVTDVQLYVDGLPQGTSAQSSKAINTARSADVRIAQDFANRYFKGLIDEVALWNHPLSADQIALLAAGVPPDDPRVTSPGSSLRFGLLANWKLDTIAGGITPDTLGNYDGTTVGDTATALGKLDYATDFDGDNDAVNFGDTSMFDNLDAFSVSMWFNRHTDRNDATNHGVDNILIAESSSADNDNFELGTDGDQVEIYLDVNGPDKTVWTAVPGGIADDAWHHLVVTYDKADGGLKLFFNGAFVDSWPEFTRNVDASGSSPLSLGMARVGSNNWGDFEGLIDEVGIWNRALSRDEIAYLYNNGYGHLIIPEPATVAVVLCGLALAGISKRGRRNNRGD